eukprot:1156149-Pelagomonas_calceolata.AAC.8
MHGSKPLDCRLGLAADQRLKLRQLLDVLPLTVTGMGKSYAPNALGVGSAAGEGVPARREVKAIARSRVEMWAGTGMGSSMGRQIL